MINYIAYCNKICACQFFVVSLHRLSNGKPFSHSGLPFQVSSQKFTIFKILSQLSSQPFSGLVIRCGVGTSSTIIRLSYGYLSVILRILLLKYECKGNII